MLAYHDNLPCSFVLFVPMMLQDVADVWKKNEKQAIATAKEWTRKYAMVSDERAFGFPCVVLSNLSDCILFSLCTHNLSRI